MCSLSATYRISYKRFLESRCKPIITWNSLKLIHIFYRYIMFNLGKSKTDGECMFTSSANRCILFFLKNRHWHFIINYSRFNFCFHDNNVIYSKQSVLLPWKYFKNKWVNITNDKGINEQISVCWFDLY